MVTRSPNAAACELDALDQRLLNDWQRGFPLQPEPFARLAEALGLDGAQVLRRLARLQAVGACSRIGGVWAAGAGGASMLCAYAVPPQRLHAVAAQVSALPGVNHNYEREHSINLWFVLTAPGPEALQAQLDALDAATGLRALRLPMLRPYRIDLGFDMGVDLHRRLAGAGVRTHRVGPPVAAADRDLAAWLEGGLPLVAQPYAQAAAATGRSQAQVLATLQRWLDAGTLRRLGVVVRHHELGFACNAMAVWDVPDAQVDGLGERLALQPGVTLCYRRRRDAGWPFNLYAMVHGRSRDEVCAALRDASRVTGLDLFAHQHLFSLRRFKQQGARLFAAATAAALPACPPEVAHAG